MNNSIVVYTAIFGNYSGLIPQPKLRNIDFVCYTDQDIDSPSWKIVKVDPPVPNDNTRSNRWYKLLPHRHLPANYEVSVYIDANIWILKNIDDLVKRKMAISKMACFDHNQNIGDKRNCIYKEYEALIRYGEEKGVNKDDPKTMKKQIDRFRAEGFPENYGLITAPILIRKHFDKTLVKVMESWWDIVAHESRRDQLSFNYVVWKLNFKDYTTIAGHVRRGNPWFYTISHRNNYKFKMFKIKFKNFLNWKKH